MASAEEGVGVDREELEAYVCRALDPSARVLDLKSLGIPSDEDVKRYGYGTAVEIVYELAGRERRAVFQTVRPGPHGHETMPDRAQLLLSNHETFSRLPSHARSLDIGAIHRDGSLRSLGDCEEFFIVTEHVDGTGYNEDFSRMRDDGSLTAEDLDRADSLCDYLIEIHSRSHEASGLYLRRIRELVGHGECIMGLTDSYPESHGFIDQTLLEDIEHRALRWRWRLKNYTHRLRQVHGDFHPWNVLFEDEGKFHILDRSRGEWGEPADDVSCLTVNYLFFSLQRSGSLEGNFKKLFERFWERYLARTGDAEMLSVVAPFFAFRGLVIASPVWYPDLSETTRRSVFAFIKNVMETDTFDPGRVNEYCET